MEVDTGGRKVKGVQGSDGGVVSTFESPAWPERTEAFPMMHWCYSETPTHHPKTVSPNHEWHKVNPGGTARTALWLCSLGNTGEGPSPELP